MDTSQRNRAKGRRWTLHVFTLWALTVLTVTFLALRQQGEPATRAPWWEDVPFDIVIGWYNQTDPVRSQLLKQYNPNGTETCGTEPNVGEIYLSLASIQHYAPWVNNIFLVVPGHRPRTDIFAPPLRSKIRVVNESEFIPAEYLPTFSSVVIEAFLDRIPGLSDFFMYMINDVFLGLPLPKSSVFSGKPGVGAVHLMPWHYIEQRPAPGRQEDWRWPFYNTGLLLREKFGAMPRLGWHAGYILTKPSLKAAWALYGDALRQAASNKFRAYKPLDQGGDVVMHLMAEHIALNLGMQELRLAKQVTSEEVQRGEYPPPDVPTFFYTESNQLAGLPAGVMQRREGGPGITYVNLNKLQRAAPGGVRSLCLSVMDIVAESFEKRYRDCMCSSDEIGGACLGL